LFVLDAPGLFHLCADKLGNVYVADSGNNLIRMVSPAGKVTTFAGTGARGHEDEVVSGAASFNNPEGVQRRERLRRGQRQLAHP
jgi:hypothetical protein